MPFLQSPQVAAPARAAARQRSGPIIPKDEFEAAILLFAEGKSGFRKELSQLASGKQSQIPSDVFRELKASIRLVIGGAPTDSIITVTGKCTDCTTKPADNVLHELRIAVTSKDGRSLGSIEQRVYYDKNKPQVDTRVRNARLFQAEKEIAQILKPETLELMARVERSKMNPSASDGARPSDIEAAKNIEKDLRSSLKLPPAPLSRFLKSAPNDRRASASRGRAHTSSSA